MEQIDVIIIGGGPAGLAAAVRLYQEGIRDILILEREHRLGGILRQCIHDGFGLTRFGETLSGPEYAQRFIDEVVDLKIPYKTDTTVIDVTNDKKIYAASKDGLFEYQAKAVILAMGCRERTRGAISIPGKRPAGVFTAGTAQSYINIWNKMVGKEVVILGSGDIGMIMARRMTLEGAHVQAVFELQPYPSGLQRNMEQCLNDYDIPLLLSHTIVDIKGRDRLEGITVAQVDENMQPMIGTERDYTCDTLILSVGLIPENELSLSAGVVLDQRSKGAIVDENYQTSVEGIFAAGNVLQVHDLVDFVSMEAEGMAEAVKNYVTHGSLSQCRLAVRTDQNITHVVPQKISGKKDINVSMRVNHPIQDCRVVICQGGKELIHRNMKKALSAEMIQIKIPAEVISDEMDLEVKVVC